MNIKELEYSQDEYDKTILKLEVSGNDVHYTLMNSIRHACSMIPTYAFHSDKIQIIKKNNEN